MRVYSYFLLSLCLICLAACETGRQVAYNDAPASHENILFDPAIDPAHHATIHDMMEKPASYRRYVSAEGKECLWLRAVPDSWIACRVGEKAPWQVKLALILPDTAFGTIP